MRKEKLLDMRLHPLVFVDLETTGLIPEEHEILETAYIVVDQKGMRVKKERVFQVKPRHIETADSESLKVIRYHERDWSAVGSLRKALAALMRDAKNGILVGQNIAVDWAFLRKALSQERIKDTMQYHRVDVMSMAFGLLYKERALKKFSLSELKKFFGIPVGNVHTALDDARATFEVYKKLNEYRK